MIGLSCFQVMVHIRIAWSNFFQNSHTQTQQYHCCSTSCSGLGFRLAIKLTRYTRNKALRKDTYMCNLVLMLYSGNTHAHAHTRARARAHTHTHTHSDSTVEISWFLGMLFKYPSHSALEMCLVMSVNTGCGPSWERAEFQRNYLPYLLHSLSGVFN